MNQRLPMDRGGEIVPEAFGEMERGLLGNIVDRRASSSFAHDQRISTPPNRYAFERVILNTRSGLKCSLLPKICGSERKRTFVPRRLAMRPSDSSLPFGFPRSNTMR